MNSFTNKILTPHEECLYAHSFYLSEEMRNKIPYFYLKVWTSIYTSERTDEINKKLYIRDDNDILFRINSKLDWKELIRFRQLGLSFRALTDRGGYVIIKPWNEKPFKERENYGR